MPTLHEVDTSVASTDWVKSPMQGMQGRVLPARLAMPLAFLPRMPNMAAAVGAPIACLFHLGHPWRYATEPHRSADGDCISYRRNVQMTRDHKDSCLMILSLIFDWKSGWAVLNIALLCSWPAPEKMCQCGLEGIR